ncbi:MAG: helix-turn-helix transcriptional regulator [Clostridiales bacterium]|nr:helix-turn-helix transcriptional regulator [Clostridiales bacterium]
MYVKSCLSTLMGKYRYSIKDVHEKTGLARGTISNLYNDKATRIDYDTIAKLCTLFHCSIDSLLMLEDINKEDITKLYGVSEVVK